MTLRQIERKYIELQEAIRNNDGVQCASVPEVFFPEDEHDPEMRKSMIKVAKEVCDDCPVRLRCFDYAYQQVCRAFGVALPMRNG